MKYNRKNLKNIVLALAFTGFTAQVGAKIPNTDNQDSVVKIDQTLNKDTVKINKKSLADCIKEATCRQTLLKLLKEFHKDVAEVLEHVKTSQEAQSALTKLSLLRRIEVTKIALAHKSHLAVILAK